MDSVGEVNSQLRTGGKTLDYHKSSCVYIRFE